MAVKLEDVLCKIAGHVTYEGTTYPVKPISATGLQLVQSIESDAPPTMAELLNLARRLCPDLPEKAWDELDAEVIGVIIGESQKRLRVVQDALPNSSGAATESPTLPSESPAT